MYEEILEAYDRIDAAKAKLQSEIWKAFEPGDGDYISPRKVSGASHRCSGEPVL